MKAKKQPNFYQILKFTQKYATKENDLNTKEIERLFMRYNLSDRTNKRTTNKKDKYDRNIYEDDILTYYDNKSVKILVRIVFLTKMQKFILVDKCGVYPLDYTNTSCFTIIGSIEDKESNDSFKKDVLSFPKEERLNIIKQSNCEKYYQELKEMNIIDIEY